MNKNLIGLWPNLSRVYEIARLGGYSIQVVFNRDYVNGFPDYKMIKAFYSEANFVARSGDLLTEIAEPDNYLSKVEYETLQDIHKRVSLAKNNFRPVEFATGSACDLILKAATERMNLSLYRIEKTKEVAGVIAQLSGSDVIRAEHIAEAVQYSYVYADAFINAQAETIEFGKGICIALHEHGREDIENAIKYLKTL